MKLNLDQLKKINETNKFIIEMCAWFEDYEEDLIFPDERIKEIIENQENIEFIDFCFPSDDSACIETAEFLNLSEEIKSIEIVDAGHIKTELRSVYLVEANGTNEDYIIREANNLKINPSDGIEVNLVDDSFFVGLAATALEEYESDYWGVITPYIAIEVIYNSKDNVLTPEIERELINSYIFEVADSTGIALTYTEIRNPMYDFEDLQVEVEESLEQKLRDLEPYNEGMKFFVSAVQIQDHELKFLNFYKVLELFSPIAVNMEANELMRKKLDVHNKLFEDGDYIRSIFDLANAMRDRFNDEDLIKASFSACFDFVGLYELLPESIKKKIKKHIKKEKLTYTTDKQLITTSSNIAGKIIYKTRNKVVHAKSNFTLTGEEITSDEMPQLNEFMKEACSQAIRWYSRQPNHMKLDVIK